MKKSIKYYATALSLLLCFSLLTACGSNNGGSANAKWEEYKNIYTTSIQYTGENESTAKYLEISERSAELFPLLEENVGAFVMDAYNYQAMDDEGTPLYEMNNVDYPVEIDPYGHSICVSRNYFRHNPIETADGSDLIEQIIYDNLTLNILVPEKHKDMEEQIIAAYRENFYFEKVQATNDYYEMAGIDETLDISEESLNINIIYVKDGQTYFTFRSDCAVATDNLIEDPVVRIYTSNIHCNYAHSFMTQWVYFPSEAEDAEAAYKDIEPYVKQCGAENSVQSVLSVYEANK